MTKFVHSKHLNVFLKKYYVEQSVNRHKKISNKEKLTKRIFQNLDPRWDTLWISEHWCHSLDPNNLNEHFLKFI